MNIAKDSADVVIKDTYDLNLKTKDQLITYMYHLLDMMPKKGRLDFVSKWINPKIALREAGALDGKLFLSEVMTFCEACLDLEYYIDPDDYDNEDVYNRYNNYDWDEPYDFHDSVWAIKFASLFQLAIMYGNNQDYSIVSHSMDALLDIIQRANEDSMILGTEKPMIYIDINWSEVFEVYFSAINNEVMDSKDFGKKLVGTWCSFKEYVDSDLIRYFYKFFEQIEEAIYYYVEMFQNSWQKQLELYELLQKLYELSQRTFPRKSIALRLAPFNANFYVAVIDELCSEEKWMEAASVIEKAISLVVDAKIIDELHRQQINCLEALGRVEEAYDLAFAMMINKPDYERYHILRRLATVRNCLQEMIRNVAEKILTVHVYDTTLILLQIYSLEENTDQLVHAAISNDGYNRHECLKYAAKSLIYRSLHANENSLSLDLKEYLVRINENQILGIIDMNKKTYSISKEAYYLNHAIEILKQIVQLHIDEAKRTRYAAAAYYCVLIRDICVYLCKEELFQQYYQNLIFRYNSKPAFKDEMKKRLGKW